MTERRLSSRDCSARTISTAASAASRPLLPSPGTARSSASSTELVVSTPKVIGTPVAAAAAVIPCAQAEAMYSKCGVAPRIRQPRQTTASTRPSFGHTLRRNRNLEGARHAQKRNVVVGKAGLAQRLLGAVQQALGDEVVEARHDDGDTHLLAFPLRAALLEKRVRAFFHVVGRRDQTEERRFEELARRPADMSPP